VDWIAPYTSNPRVANLFGPSCIQDVSPGKAQIWKSNVTSEDCLTLNIFRPKSAAGASLLPVMTFIHGGSFEYGGSADYGGEALAAKEGVIVITLNYRLGALGFMALREAHEAGKTAGGNYGLLDQAAALRWIKREAH